MTGLSVHQIAAILGGDVIGPNCGKSVLIGGTA
jgi:hypothetical protein